MHMSFSECNVANLALGPVDGYERLLMSGGRGVKGQVDTGRLPVNLLQP